MRSTPARRPTPEEYLRIERVAPTDMTMQEFLQYKEMIRGTVRRVCSVMQDVQ